jgi:hypothetical protein
VVGVYCHWLRDILVLLGIVESLLVKHLLIQEVRLRGHHLRG